MEREYKWCGKDVMVYRKSELVVREGRSSVRGTAGGVGVEQSEDGEAGRGV